MQITVHLPDDVAERENPGREALEALVAEGYRNGTLNRKQLRSMLGFATGQEVDGFLKQRQIERGAYSAEDYDRDLAVIESMSNASRE
jgi:hypothetical protein